MTLEVDIQTLGHLILQFTAFLMLLTFVVYEGVIRRRLGPLAIIWMVALSGQLIKCSTKFVRLETYDTLSTGGQAIVQHSFGLVGVLMACCLWAIGLLYYYAGLKGDYPRFRDRGLRMILPAIALGLLAGMFAWRSAGAPLEHYGNLVLLISLLLHLFLFIGIGRRCGWFADRVHVVAAVVLSMQLTAVILSAVAVGADFYPGWALTAVMPFTAFHYLAYSVTVRALNQHPSLAPQR